MDTLNLSKPRLSYGFFYFLQHIDCFCFFELRYACFKESLEQIEEQEGGLQEFTQGYRYFGMIVNPDNSITCREWAPGAQQLYLYGEFSKLKFLANYHILILA